MKLELTRRDDCPTSFELPEGTHTVGEGAHDSIHLEGFGPGLLELRREGPHVTLLARDTLAISGVLFPARVPRTLLVGEPVELSEGLCLCLTAQAAASSTAQVLRQLIAEQAAPGCEAPGLLCLAGTDRGRSLLFTAPVSDLGRARSVQLRVRDPAVSRRHARLRLRERVYWLEDAGSLNRIFLNGVSLKAPTPLKDGDLIELGHTLARVCLPREPLPPLAAEPGESSHAPLLRPGVAAFPLEWSILGFGAALAVLATALTAALA